MSKSKSIKPILLVITLLLLAGCGSDAGVQSTPAPTTAGQVAVAPTQEKADETPPTEVIPPTIAANEGSAPTDVPGEAQPTLVSESGGIGGGSAQDAIVSSLRTQAAVGSYRGLVTIVGASTPTTMTMEVVRPDRMRTIVDLGITQREMINIGPDAYMSSPNGWMKIDAQSAALTTVNPLLGDQSQIEEYIDQNKGSWANARLVGTETVNGKSTRVYEYTVSVPYTVGDQTTTTDSLQKLWIGEADNLPYQLQVNSEVNLGGDDVTTTTTFSFYDYNADIKIDVPSPLLNP